MRFHTKEQNFVDDVMFGRATEEQMEPPEQRGEITHNKYGDTWGEARQATLERDDHECKVCGATESRLGQELDIHHIKPFRTFESAVEANQVSNLVSLCRKHHSQYEGNRTEMKKLMEADE